MNIQATIGLPSTSFRVDLTFENAKNVLRDANSFLAKRATSDKAP